MKNVVFVLAASLISFSACAQKLKEKDVPTLVKETFKKNFSGAKEVKWEKEDGNYEVGFEIGEIEQSVVMNAEGKILETEVEIKVDELPAAAKDYLAKNHQNAKIKEACKIVDAAGTVMFEAEVGGKDLIFDSNGTFIKEEIEKDDDKD